MKGIITAMITPFRNDDEIDYEAFAHNINFQIEAGIDGILLLGSTGEAATIRDEERTELLKFAIPRLKGKTHVMVGTSSNSTKKAIEYTLEAEKLGADSALVVTPYYNCPTQEGIFSHFSALSSHSAIPLVVYNNPKRTGRAIMIDTFLKLSTLPTIAAIKEASGDIGVMQELLEKMPSSLALFSGDDHLAFCTKALGGAGLISVASNLIPKLMKRVIESEFIESRKLHFHLQPLFRALFLESNPIPIKTAMNYWKMASGHCRLPLSPMKHPERLYEVLDGYSK